MGRLSLMFDLERCIGCKSCEAACKQEHGLGPGEYRNRVVWLPDGEAPGLDFLDGRLPALRTPGLFAGVSRQSKAISERPGDRRRRCQRRPLHRLRRVCHGLSYGAMGYDPRG